MGGGAHFKCADCKVPYAMPYTQWGGTGRGTANSIVSQAIANGLVKPADAFECADCGVQAQQYDHRDYNKPLEVEPVCRRCNQLRGPAVPRYGYFAHFFVNGGTDYANRKRMAQLLAIVGIQADLSHLPGRVKFEHWLPFKEVLLEWERAKQSEIQDKST